MEGFLHVKDDEDNASQRLTVPEIIHQCLESKSVEYVSRIQSWTETILCKYADFLKYAKNSYHNIGEVLTRIGEKISKEEISFQYPKYVQDSLNDSLIGSEWTSVYESFQKALRSDEGPLDEVYKFKRLFNEDIQVSLDKFSSLQYRCTNLSERILSPDQYLLLVLQFIKTKSKCVLSSDLLRSYLQTVYSDLSSQEQKLDFLFRNLKVTLLVDFENVSESLLDLYDLDIHKCLICQGDLEHKVFSSFDLCKHKICVQCSVDFLFLESKCPFQECVGSRLKKCFENESGTETILMKTYLEKCMVQDTIPKVEKRCLEIAERYMELLEEVDQIKKDLNTILIQDQDKDSLNIFKKRVYRCYKNRAIQEKDISIKSEVTLNCLENILSSDSTFGTVNDDITRSITAILAFYDQVSYIKMSVLFSMKVQYKLRDIVKILRKTTPDLEKLRQVSISLDNKFSSSRFILVNIRTNMSPEGPIHPIVLKIIFRLESITQTVSCTLNLEPSMIKEGSSECL